MTIIGMNDECYVRMDNLFLPFLVCTWQTEIANTRSQHRAEPEIREAIASTAYQAAAATNPLVPPPAGGWSETFPLVAQQNPDPLLTLVTPETAMMDNVMRVVTETLNRQQEDNTWQQ